VSHLSSYDLSWRRDHSFLSLRPLRPATCQSVRMEFLALVPGVHTLDVLTLTDVESGFAMNLR